MLVALPEGVGSTPTEHIQAQPAIHLVLFRMLVLFVFACWSTAAPDPGLPVAPPTAPAPSRAAGQRCAEDASCGDTGFICDYSLLCSPPRSASSPAPCSSPTGDHTCHPVCRSAADCHAPYTLCKSGRRFLGGDVGSVYQACF